jgi:hypothetical protein
VAAAKGLGERAHRPHRSSIERADRDAESIENPDLELLHGLVTELNVISRGDEPGKLFDLSSSTIYDAHVSKANRSRIETMPSTVPSLVTGMCRIPRSSIRFAITAVSSCRSAV